MTVGKNARKSSTNWTKLYPAMSSNIILSMLSPYNDMQDTLTITRTTLLFVLFYSLVLIMCVNGKRVK